MVGLGVSNMLKEERKERSKSKTHSAMAELKGKRKETSKAIRPMRAKERKWLKQSQDKWLVFNVT